MDPHLPSDDVVSAAMMYLSVVEGPPLDFLHKMFNGIEAPVNPPMTVILETCFQKVTVEQLRAATLRALTIREYRRRLSQFESLLTQKSAIENGIAEFKRVNAVPKFRSPQYDEKIQTMTDRLMEAVHAVEHAVAATGADSTEAHLRALRDAIA